MAAWCPTTPENWWMPAPMCWSREARFSALPTMLEISAPFVEGELYLRVNCNRTFIPLSHNGAIVWPAAWAAYRRISFYVERLPMFRKTLVAAVALAAVASGAQARDQIRIVGSSTVYPFSTAVAEQFGKTSGFKTPVVESTGTGGGLKLFCAGADENTPDIVNASRRIEKSEVDACAANGVKDVT